MSEKVWFITGCSTGFGRQIAKKAIEAGHKVAVTARNTDQIQDLVAGKEAHTIALALDVTNQTQVKEAVQNTIEQFGRIDVLVNNA